MAGQRPQPRTQDDLLKWSIAQSGNGAQDANMQEIAKDIADGKRPDLADPALYQALMGKSEAQMMQEELAAALDSNRSEEDRVQALDNFEMLIEQIDNANNMTNMKMWQPLLTLLTEQSSTPGIQTATLWILGTAVQNNDKAQMEILQHEPLKPILSLLSHGADGQVRSKALYALSGIIKHNAKAVDLFGKEDGWSALKGALLDPDVSLRRKAAFLVNTLLLQDDSSQRKHKQPTESSAPLSSSRALAPVGNAASAPSSDLPPMPLEQGPATLRSGVDHPCIPPLLVSSGLLATLIASLLSPGEVPSDATDSNELSTAAGPDGDIELRNDLDYAEKGVRASLTFVEQVRKSLDSQGSVAAQAWAQVDDASKRQARSLLQALIRDLQGPAVESASEKRWQELGLQASEVDTLTQDVSSL